jgi:ribosomal protein S18 acetylase RimI-like enzyme
MTVPTVRPAAPDEIELVLSVPSDTPHDLRAGWAAREYRPEWTWLALDGDTVVGRAAWWGWPDAEHPVLMDVLDLPDRPDAVEVGAALTAAGMAGLVPPGQDRLVTLSAPRAWRDDPALGHVTRLRLAAVERAGLTLLVERATFWWRAGGPVPPPSERLVYRPVAEVGLDALVDVVARCDEGTLDAHSRRSIERIGLRSTARAEVDEMLDFPGPTSWWRLGYTPDGRTVGFVLPTVNARAHNVGFIGVVPERRGHGYVDDLLGECTRLLVAEGAVEIVGGTDLGNLPMAAAFRRAGYVESDRRRLDLV